MWTFDQNQRKCSAEPKGLKVHSHWEKANTLLMPGDAIFKINEYSYLPATNEVVAKVWNIFTPVCHSVHRGGRGSASVHAGIPPPPGPDPPREQTPPPWEADTSIRSTSGRYASYWNAFLSFECIYYNVFAFSRREWTLKRYDVALERWLGHSSDALEWDYNVHLEELIWHYG